LTPALGFVSGLAWSADGRDLLYAKGQYAVPSPPSLWRLATSGEPAPEHIAIAGTAGYPAVSTSGARLAFVRRNLNEDLLVLREGRQPETLLASSYNEQDVSISPDGAKIAFATDRTADTTEIWVSQIDDPASRRGRQPPLVTRWSAAGF
jgi:Tol biopolymer transport system component